MPGAPSEDQKLQVSRTVPNPFFSIPLKEPPKYDEAVRSKQQQHVSLKSIQATYDQFVCTYRHISAFINCIN